MITFDEPSDTGSWDVDTLRFEPPEERGSRAGTVARVLLVIVGLGALAVVIALGLTALTGGTGTSVKPAAAPVRTPAAVRQPRVAAKPKVTIPQQIGGPESEIDKPGSSSAATGPAPGQTAAPATGGAGLGDS